MHPIVHLLAALFALLLSSTHAAAATTTLSTPPPSSSCRVQGRVAARSVHRGMYVSMQTTHLAGQVLPPPLNNILGNTAYEDALLAYIISQQFDSLSMYNLNVILFNSTLSQQLSSFIRAARACGVAEVNAIGSVASDWPLIKYYQCAFGPDFDGVVTEVEFWNTGSDYGTVRTVADLFSDFINQLKFIHKLQLTGRQNKPMMVTAYIGLLDNNSGKTEIDVAAALLQNVDRVFVHSYTTDPALAYNYHLDRIKALQAAANKPVFPIFSAEAEFMGGWLAAHSPPSLEAAEASYSNVISLKGFRPAGFQYYEYVLMRLNSVSH